MRIFFWNLRRLGESSDPTRGPAIENLYRRIKDVDYWLFCELNVSAKDPIRAQNLTYKAGTNNQLCYGCLDKNRKFKRLRLRMPEVTDGYKAMHFKGGDEFKNLAQRALGYMGQAGGAHIYVIHAPAKMGKRAMWYVASHLHEKYGNTPWFLIGDFNVVPGVLRNTKGRPFEISDYIAKSGLMTKGKHEYDYVLSNFASQITVQRLRVARNLSDHHAIYATW